MATAQVFEPTVGWRNFASGDLPSSGVSAGTYGDSTHVGQFTVAANGTITAASNVAISGGGGGSGLVKLYDSGAIGVAAASIDTGASGIASGHNDLIIMAVCQVTTGSDFGQVDVTFNNDTGSNYDWQVAFGSGSATGATSNVAQSSLLLAVAGSGSSYAGAIRIDIPSYDLTNFYKVGVCETMRPATTAADQGANLYSLGYRSTTAISRMKIAAHTNTLAAGSRLVVYGAQ